MFRLGRDGSDARDGPQAPIDALDSERDTSGARIDHDFGIGDAIGSVIHSTMFGLIRTFDASSYEDANDQARRR